MLEREPKTGGISVAGYAVAREDEFTWKGVRNAYLEQAVAESDVEDNDRELMTKVLLQQYVPRENYENSENYKNNKIEDAECVSVFGSKKYKPVALKVRPMYQELPDRFRIKREIIGDPLAAIPKLSPNPPDFTETGRYTQERMEKMDKVHKGDFLWPEERKLVHHLIMEQNEAFAWSDPERGKFREDFFPPVEMPVVEHKPWVLRNIPIPPGIYAELCKLIKSKIDSGVYEPSNSSYRSRWFTVVKKDGKTLRIVHSLEPLNAVTIAHSGLPPATEELAAHFAGRACGGMFDLYVGYDERPLAESSRDLTTFQTPFGAMRLVTLPMGWTNSVPIFHDDVTYILQDEIPEFTIPYIDDVPVRGPASRYQLPNGDYEVIPGNKGIRRFVWDHVNKVNDILQRMKYAGGTFSGYKSIICAEEIEVVGHVCAYEGRHPSADRIGVIERWGPCQNIGDVRSFMGTVGVLRNFIPNYAKRAEHIQKLMRGKTPFEWGPLQEQSMEMLKDGVRNANSIKPLDYEGQGAIVLAVDTSWRAVGFYIYQEDAQDPKKKYYAKFGSILLNEREARFSQPKREMFGVKRALEVNSHLLIGARKFIIETDAKYLKGMLEHPDQMPNATINRWIEQIMMYHFTLRHKAGATFGPDGLSRRDGQPGDEEYEDPGDDMDEPAGPPLFEQADPTEPEPLAIEDFRDKIDTRGGYFAGVAKSLEDFQNELEKACEMSRNEQMSMINKMRERKISSAQERFITQFVTTLVLPDPSEKTDLEKLEPYVEDHRTWDGKLQDERIPLVRTWLKDPHLRPEGYNDKQYLHFARFGKHFFLDPEGRLYRRSIDAAHKLFVEKSHRMYMMKAAHDSLGHRGFYATKSLLLERFWWPELERDVSWYVKTCHICQERQKALLKIPPVVTHTPSIFQVLHADTMHMTPKSNGCGYIVHGRDALTSYPEARAIRQEDARSIGQFLFEDVICRWGCLQEIVTDNGGPFKAAVAWLERKYGIKGIRISAYNSKANGAIERPHWDVRQMLYKATDGNVSKWFWFLAHVIWADRITIRRRLGCSPFYAVTGANPILPLDIQEATWLVKLPGRVLTTEEKIGYRAQALSKHALFVGQLQDRTDKEKLAALLRYERDHKAVIKDFKFGPGDLVLVRNTSVESSLDKKMKPRYLGPMIVISRSKGGAYIVAEMDGAVWHQKVGAFRVLPYFARRKISIPDNIHELIDLSREGLKKLQDLPDPDTGHLKDYTFDGIKLAAEGEILDSEQEDDMDEEES